MIKQVFNVEHYWKVIVYYIMDYNFFGNAISELHNADAPWETIKTIFDDMSSCRAKAVTFSNIEKHISIVIINPHNSKVDLLNSIVHEAEHIKQAMLKAYKIEDAGEPPAYTVGYLMQKMWGVVKRLI